MVQAATINMAGLLGAGRLLRSVGFIRKVDAGMVNAAGNLLKALKSSLWQMKLYYMRTKWKCPSRYLHIPVTGRGRSFTRRSSVGLPRLHVPTSRSTPGRRGSEPTLSQARGPVNVDLREAQSASNPHHVSSPQRPRGYLIKYSMVTGSSVLSTCLSVSISFNLLGCQMLTLMRLGENCFRVQKCLKHVQRTSPTNRSQSFDLTFSRACLI